MSYVKVEPLAKKDEYRANENIDLIISQSEKNVAQGSLFLVGEYIVAKDATAGAVTFPSDAEEITLDSDAGCHSFVRDIVTEFGKKGLVETFQNYPRYVKMKTQATRNRFEMGTNTRDSIEGKCLSKTVARGVNMGRDAEAWQPFSIQPEFCLNKTSGDIDLNETGDLRIRLRLPPNYECVQGSDATAVSGYILKNLALYYRLADKPKSKSPSPTVMEVYNCSRQIIETNNANLSTYVPGKFDSVHMSFRKVSEESSVTGNFIRCEPLPGLPKDATTPTDTYGAEKVVFAVNDTDTALAGFEIDTRNEILWNYLRSFTEHPSRFNVVMSRFNGPEPDAYGAGISFGQTMDFSDRKFTAEIKSKVAEPYAVYMYFRGLLTF